jgi:hypothetical protein
MTQVAEQKQKLKVSSRIESNTLHVSDPKVISWVDFVVKSYDVAQSSREEIFIKGQFTGVVLYKFKSRDEAIRVYLHALELAV